MKLILGLGNPGVKYSRTRHNIGFIALDAYAAVHNLKWDEKKKFLASICETEINDKRLALAKPNTFMNASGESARKLIDFYNIKHHDVLVIHDDADIELGKLRLVQGGNDGGHQGIASLYQHGMKDTWRLKVGVANEDRLPGRAIDFVLRSFTAEEEAKLVHLVKTIESIMTDFAHGKIESQTISV